MPQRAFKIIFWLFASTIHCVRLALISHIWLCYEFLQTFTTAFTASGEWLHAVSFLQHFQRRITINANEGFTL